MIKFEILKDSEIGIFIDFHKKLNNLIGFTDSVLDDPEIIECLRQDLASNDTCYIVAKENDNPVGLISVDFRHKLEFNGKLYTAAIPLIYIEENNRNGILSYDMLKLALTQCKKRGANSVAISVEDNNPHKFLHFAIADTLIDTNEEYLTDDQSVTQFILGISNVETLLNTPMSKLARKISETRRNFNKRLQELNLSTSEEKET